MHVIALEMFRGASVECIVNSTRLDYGIVQSSGNLTKLFAMARNTKSTVLEWR